MFQNGMLLVAITANGFEDGPRGEDGEVPSIILPFYDGDDERDGSTSVERLETPTGETHGDVLDERAFEVGQVCRRRDELRFGCEQVRILFLQTAALLVDENRRLGMMQRVFSPPAMSRRCKGARIPLSVHSRGQPT